MNASALTSPSRPGDVSFLVGEDANTAVLRFSGEWTQQASLAKPVGTLVAELESRPGLRRIVLRADGLGDWDSRLPTYLIKLTDHCRDKGIESDVSGLPEGVRGLLALARAVPERKGARRTASQTPFLAKLGKAVLAGWKDGLDLLGFVGETLIAGLALIRGKARFRLDDLWLCIQEAGPDAFPIVSLISLLVGLILAFVGAVQLSQFGAQIFIADLVGLGMVREMGALMTAIIMSGRTGAAYAAKLGSMSVNSEIDALKTMGLSPMQFLVLPRVLALIVMMPLLTLYANLLGIVGGALVSVGAFDVSWVQYYNQTRRAVHVPDFSIGLFKSLVFGVLIATAGCMRGMQCGRSASAVGEAATAAVVNSIVYIIVADAVITLVCNQLGI